MPHSHSLRFTSYPSAVRGAKAVVRGALGLVPVVSVLAAFGALVAFASPALAGEPQAWALGFQPAAGPLQVEINAFHNLLLVITTVIVVFIMGLLLYVALRFNERANPTPSSTTHNARLEVIWTAVPVLILLFIAFFSFPILYNSGVVPDSKYTIKAVGHQWYWSFEYETPEGEVFTFDSLLLPDDEAAERDLPRLLAVDEPMLMPVGLPVRVVVTSQDVLHAFAVPAFGVKMDAVPGRLNETWAQADLLGTYYGQCSELCGSGHAYMPLMVEVVEEDEFIAWLREAQVRFAVAPAAPATPDAPAATALARNEARNEDTQNFNSENSRGNRE